MHWVSISEFKSSATFQFIKACNECLAMTAKAYVPGYSPLDYLLVYGDAVLICLSVPISFCRWFSRLSTTMWGVAHS